MEVSIFQAIINLEFFKMMIVIIHILVSVAGIIFATILKYYNDKNNLNNDLFEGLRKGSYKYRRIYETMTTPDKIHKLFKNEEGLKIFRYANRIIFGSLLQFFLIQIILVENDFYTDQERQMSMVCGNISARIRCGMRPHFDGEEGYRRCNDNVAEIIRENGIASKLEFNNRFGKVDDFYKDHTPVGLSCIRTEKSEYFIAVETSIGFCGGKCTGIDFFDSHGDRVEIDLSSKDLVHGNSIYIEEGYDHE